MKSFSQIAAFDILIATGVFIAFVVVLLIGSRYLPGKEQEGALLPDGTRQTYKLNALPLFVLVLIAVSVLPLLDLTLAPLIEWFWPLFIAANIFSVLFTLILYFQGPEREERGPFNGFWYGTELNPTWWGVDLKMFSYRPSLIGLALLNIACAYMQYETYGFVSDSMWLYQIFTNFYLLSTFQYEGGMLSMFDIIEERFGFMLVWGDYVLVPFFYCVPGLFIIEQTAPLSVPVIVGLCAMYVLGFWMFRGANSQKHQFKRDPEAPIWGKKPEAIDGRLLVSGFWGIGRKLNYTGEITVYVSWTLLAGFDSFLPWLLPLWLTSLLVHRAWRDDKRCRAKYGELWERYCNRVRFRMLPFIY